MKNIFLCLAMTSLIALASPAAQAQSGVPTPPDAVTVVIQLTLKPGKKREAANAVGRDIRALINRQPGLLSEEFLQNNNPSASPSYIHVTRWASFKDWESIFTSSELTKLQRAGANAYAITVSAFKAAK